MALQFYNPLNPKSAAFSNDPRQWPDKAVVKTHFGQRVLWHAVQDGGRHVPAAQLEEYRHIGDPIVDEIFALRAQEGQPIKAGDDLLAMMIKAAEEAARDNHNDQIQQQQQQQHQRPASVQALYELYQTYAQTPSWVDPLALQRGQDVYLAYLPAISMSLYYRSLVPGFAIPRIAAVLQSTGYLAPPAPRHDVHNRLMDTGALLMRSFCALEDILPGGEGWKTCLQVRFLHAKVRWGLLQRRGGRKWDVDKLGIPINEEDMNATLLAFSANALLGTEMLLGFPVPERDRLDYLAIWRYLGWLLGVPVLDDHDVKRNTWSRIDGKRLRPLDPCGPGWIPDRPQPTEHAYAVFQSIILHLLHPDELSVKISNHLLRLGRDKDATPETQENQESWYYYRTLQCRRFVGNYLADALQLPLHKTAYQRWRQWTVSTLSLFCWTVYTWAGLPWSPFRFILIRYHRYYMRKFAAMWQTTHAKRMEEKLAGEQACPFAMVAPPMY